ncbi:hypothetical protein [Aureivirga sp. CE67]|uniref:hypothetical protein n=1 Tax=Aureivirga sp. CE67 TaxID=1788983 RepID=UPI0018C8E08E|nr:hypothetical protein [Aureivirga sp. CE67]
MKKLLILLLTILLISCNEKDEKQNKNVVLEPKKEIKSIVTEDFEFWYPNEIEQVLILFDGFGGNALNIQKEFTIKEKALDENVAILYFNFNQRLFLTEEEKYQLAKQLQDFLETKHLSNKDIFIGGFSSGGNVAMQLGEFIMSRKQFYIDPKGVFVVDSPVDLLALYRTSAVNIQNDFSKESVAESKWLLQFLNKEFGRPEDSIRKYEKNSIFTLETQNIKNVKRLKNTKLRFYTEPDVEWWRENRKNEYENLNAFSLEKLAEILKKKKSDVELILTKNKGFRINGERHPHSWSIVNQEELIKWVKN